MCRERSFHALEKAFAEFLPPEVAQVAIPQQREQHFLFENRFWRRRQTNLFFLRRVAKIFLAFATFGDIEQFEEAIDRVAFGETVRNSNRELRNDRQVAPRPIPFPADRSRILRRR